MINKSLMHLMRCLQVIRQNQVLSKNGTLNKKWLPVPYRDSKLTMLLRDCFAYGNYGKVAMIVNASAEGADFDETLHALKYGALAKQVCVKNDLPRNDTNKQHRFLYNDNGHLIRGVVRKNRPSQITIEENAQVQKPVGSEETAKAPGFNFVESRVLPFGMEINDIQRLIDDRAMLQRELAELRSHCISLETEIREEVALEMAERLMAMEKVYNERLDAATLISEGKTAKKISNMKRRIHLNTPKVDKNTLDNIVSAQDVKDLAQQVNECEEEMARMRTVHESQVSALMKQLDATKRALQETKAEQSNLIRKSLASSAKASLLVTDASLAERQVNDRLLAELEHEKEKYGSVIQQFETLEEELTRVKSERDELRQTDVNHQEEFRLKDQLLKEARTRLLEREHEIYALKAKELANQPSLDEGNLKRETSNLLRTSVLEEVFVGALSETDKGTQQGTGKRLSEEAVHDHGVESETGDEENRSRNQNRKSGIVKKLARKFEPKPSNEPSGPVTRQRSARARIYS